MDEDKLILVSLTDRECYLMANVIHALIDEFVKDGNFSKIVSEYSNATTVMSLVRVHDKILGGGKD